MASEFIATIVSRIVAEWLLQLKRQSNILCSQFTKQPQLRTSQYLSISMEEMLSSHLLTALNIIVRSRLTADVKKLTPSSKEFFVFVDFNARSNAWNCARSITAGNVLNNFKDISHFFVHYSNSLPTFWCHAHLQSSFPTSRYQKTTKWLTMWTTPASLHKPT